MTDDSSNGSNTRALNAIRATGSLITWSVELYVLGEILCTYVAGEHLHTLVMDRIEDRRARAAHRASVEDTRAMIRDLPET